MRKLTELFIYIQNSRGIETLEWVLIGGLITGVAIAVYPGTLKPVLTGAVNAVGGVITTAVGT